MAPPWPPGFQRIPDDEWTQAPVESLALKYDTVERHGWYANLGPTVEELSRVVEDGHVLLDYSGGTGILIDRLLAAMPGRRFGVVDVDSSPKFLRLALEKFRNDERVAFRLIRFLPDAKRLQFVDEVLGEPLLARRVDAIASTNAVHLYQDLDETLRSWARVLKPGGRVLVQSGNIRVPGERGGAWIIDDTVEAAHRAAMDIVQRDERYARYRGALDDAARMALHDALRRRFFLPPRPLGTYIDALERAGLQVVATRTHPIAAKTAEWREFLAVYHEGVLGWVGGSPRVEGREPDEAALLDRQRLLTEALDAVFQGGASFEATWTYITCVAPA